MPKKKRYKITVEDTETRSKVSFLTENAEWELNQAFDDKVKKGAVVKEPWEGCDRLLVKAWSGLPLFENFCPGININKDAPVVTTADNIKSYMEIK